jgi:hypothetical protein
MFGAQAMGLIKKMSKKFEEAEKEVDLAKMEGHIKSYTNEFAAIEKVPETINHSTGVSHIPEDNISKIGELDVELHLRIKKVNEEIKVIFTAIDAVRLREVKWTGTLIMGIVGTLIAGITFGLLFVYTDLHLGWICFIALGMMAVTAVVLYFQFAHLALKRGRLDGL